MVLAQHTTAPSGLVFNLAFYDHKADFQPLGHGLPREAVGC